MIGFTPVDGTSLRVIHEKNCREDLKPFARTCVDSLDPIFMQFEMLDFGRNQELGESFHFTIAAMAHIPLVLPEK